MTDYTLNINTSNMKYHRAYIQRICLCTEHKHNINYTTYKNSKIHIMLKHTFTNLCPIIIYWGSNRIGPYPMWLAETQTGTRRFSHIKIHHRIQTKYTYKVTMQQVEEEKTFLSCIKSIPIAATIILSTTSKSKNKQLQHQAHTIITNAHKQNHNYCQHKHKQLARSNKAKQGDK